MPPPSSPVANMLPLHDRCGNAVLCPLRAVPPAEAGARAVNVGLRVAEAGAGVAEAGEGAVDAGVRAAGAGAFGRQGRWLRSSLSVGWVRRP